MQSRRGFLKMLGLGSAAVVVPGAAAIGSRVLKEADIDPEIVEDVIPVTSSDLDPHIPEYWAKHSLDMLMEQSSFARDFTPQITDEGVNHTLDCVFTGKKSTDDWQIGLISATGFTGLCVDDTLDDHCGWEASNETPQPLAETTTFNLTKCDTIKGVYTFSEAEGIIWSKSLFPTDVAVVNGDILKVNMNLEGIKDAFL